MLTKRGHMLLCRFTCNSTFGFQNVLVVVLFSMCIFWNRYAYNALRVQHKTIITFSGLVGSIVLQHRVGDVYLSQHRRYDRDHV